MALGLSRLQPRSNRPAAVSPAVPPASNAQEHDWLAQRGAVLFDAPCDVFGGFPGFADLGGQIDGGGLQISERFLTVDEGRPRGFGIPVSWLDAALMTESENGEECDLRLAYNDGAAARMFTLRFRPNRLAKRGGKRAERALDALRAAGFTESGAYERLQAPDFSLPWERTREFDSENVIWTGNASGPVRIGQELAPSEIWLSTRSLIWGSSEGSGLNRVALPELGDVVSSRLKDRFGTPATFLSVAGEGFGRYELPFVFDQQETPDRNFRERGAFQTALRSRALPEGAPAPLWQPWRLDILPPPRSTEPPAAVAEEPLAAPRIETAGLKARLESWLPRIQGLTARGLALPTVAQDQATVVAFTPAEIAQDEAADIVDAAPETAYEDVTFLPPAGASLEGTSTDVDPEPSAASEPAEELETPSREPIEPEATRDQRATERLDALAPIEEFAASKLDAEPIPTADLAASEPPEAAAQAPVSAVERFETTALAVIADGLRMIDIRLETGSLEPLGTAQSLRHHRELAIAEISELGRAKTLKKRAMRAGIERIHVLEDIGVRLRSVIELYDRCRLDNPELEKLRAKLVARIDLSSSAVPLAAPGGETVPNGETLFQSAAHAETAAAPALAAISSHDI